MGKGEENSTEESVDEKPTSPDETTQDKNEPETDENKVSEPPSEETPKIEKTESDDSKKDADSIRQVIKLESTDTKEGKTEANTEKKDDTSSDSTGSDELVDSDAGTTTRESLEQKRAILQSIKDFDFQIKKNQEEISGLVQRLDAISKDLDDLVSLYEIVSEQMNPFVGLSKVTKKRIDALENFIKEVENLKNRIGDLESFAEQTGAKIERYDEEDKKPVAPKSKKSESMPDVDLNKIIDKVLDMLSTDSEIDIEIDEFIEDLKNESNSRR